MARVGYTGFDFIGGPTVLWNSARMVSEVVRTGQAALRVGAGFDGHANVIIPAADGSMPQGTANLSVANCYSRFYLYMAAYPTSVSVGIHTVQNSTQDSKLQVNLNTSGQLVCNGTTGSAVVPLSGWVRVESFVPATGNFTVRLYNTVGVLQETLSGAVTNTGNSVWVRVGNFGSGVTAQGTYYFDDLSVDDTTWCGGGKVESLVPNADGNYTAFVAGTGGTYLELDDTTLSDTNDGDTSYQTSSTASAKESCQFPNITTGYTPNSVLGMVAARDENQVVTWQMTVRGGSTPTDGTYTTSLDNSTVAYFTRGKIFNADPTGAAWTSGTVNAAEVVVNRTQSQARPLRISSMKLIVDSTEPTGPATYTGTSARSFGAATATGSATYRSLSQGTGTPTFGKATATGSATRTAPTYSSTGTPTFGKATGTGAATFSPGTKTGTVAKSFGAATGAGSATFSPGTKTATGAPAFGVATGSGTATHTRPTYTGTAAPTFGAATATGSATHTTPTYSGTVAKNFGAVTATGSATRTTPTFTASTGGGAGNDAAWDFDGTDDRLYRSSPEEALKLWQAGTVEFYVKLPGNWGRSDGNPDTVIGWSGTGGNIPFSIQFRFGYLAFNHSVGFGGGTEGLWQLSSLVGTNDGGWYHIAVSWSGGTASAYVDGQPVGTSQSVGSLNPGTGVSCGDLEIGHTAFSDYFLGSLDEVRLWNTERTPTQIDDNWDRQLTGSESGLVGYWPGFASESGNSVVDDWTSNGYDLTISGPTWDTGDYPTLTGGGTGPSFGAATAAGTATQEQFFTATGSPAFGKATGSGAAAFTAPVYSGTAAPTFGAAAATGSATHTRPTYTGTGNPTVGAATGSGTAETQQLFAATGSPSFGKATGSGSATHTTPVYTGTSARSFGATTGSGTATHTPPVYTGTSTRSFGAATGSGSATHTRPTYTGTAARTFGATTGAGTATFTAPVYTGTSARSFAPATTTGAALHTPPTYTGSAAGTFGGVTGVGQGVTQQLFSATGNPTVGAATGTGVATFSSSSPRKRSLHFFSLTG